MFGTDKPNDVKKDQYVSVCEHNTRLGKYLIYSFAYFTLVYQLTLAFAYVFMQISEGALTHSRGLCVSRFLSARLCVFVFNSVGNACAYA